MEDVTHDIEDGHFEKEMDAEIHALYKVAEDLGYNQRKKRKVNATESDDSDDESNDSDDAESDGGSDSRLGGQPYEAELEKWQARLKKADEDIAKAQADRRTAVRNLRFLDVTVIERPWTKSQLELKIELLKEEMAREELEAAEDAGEWVEFEDPFRTIQIERMEDAIKKRCQFDGKGYIDTDGTRIDFKPSEIELEDAIEGRSPSSDSS